MNDEINCAESAFMKFPVHKFLSGYADRAFCRMPFAFVVFVSYAAGHIQNFPRTGRLPAESSKVEIDNPIKMFDRLCDMFKLTNEQKEIVFAALQMNHEFWLFGFVNAFNVSSNQTNITLESRRRLQKIEGTVLLEGVQA